ncbi:MAG: MBL fold metallo-hydrolase [Deltaproteobacteria bacterium]|nr:MBL fold metallo-hydrolase [Deltaproteobacteria bacterium]
MYFNQITVPGLGCNSYVIGCPGARQAIVVDPKRDVQDYMDISRDEGMKITHIIETHVHADHVSGNQELKSRTGAAIYYGEGSPVTFDHKELKEGDVIEFGTVKLEIVNTPGHTPNSISVLVTDKARSEAPELILTGDLLFVGSIGRPDLAGAEVLEDQVKNLYDSLYEKLRRLPDYLEVFPAHGQGSLCGKGLSAKASSTLGYERLTQTLLQLPGFKEFHDQIAGDFPVRPKSFTHIISTNTHGVPLLERCPLEQTLNPDQFEQIRQQGATIIDTRDTASFGGFHIHGAINIGFEKQMANWIGMVVDPSDNLLLVVDDRDKYDQMTTQFHRIGYDNIFGYLSGGMAAWISSGMPIDSLSPISAHILKQQLDNKNFGQIVDVRTPEERAQGHIPDSRHVPMTDILANSLNIPKDEEVILVCGTGYRANIVASHLKQDGFSHVHSLAGGLTAWQNAGYGLAADIAIG